MELPAVVPAGKLFLLGDNRSSSLDSRYWGFADESELIGLATVIYASVNLPALPGDLEIAPSAPGDAGTIRWDRIGKVVK